MAKQNNAVFPETLSHPPEWALRTIQGGPLKGKSDIKPQWRYQAMTEQFGRVGDGWYYTIDKLWREDGAQGVVFAFAMVSLYVRVHDTQSEPIQGIGGSQLVEATGKGLKPNDEGYKMAVTDALSTAMQKLGVASAVYSGQWDGSKYKDQHDPKDQPPPKEKTVTNADLHKIKDAREKAGLTPEQVMEICKGNPFSCQNPPYDMLSKHTTRLIEKIQEQVKGEQNNE